MAYSNQRTAQLSSDALTIVMCTSVAGRTRRCSCQIRLDHVPSKPLAGLGLAYSLTGLSEDVRDHRVHALQHPSIVATPCPTRRDRPEVGVINGRSSGQPDLVSSRLSSRLMIVASVVAVGLSIGLTGCSSLSSGGSDDEQTVQDAVVDDEPLDVAIPQPDAPLH